MVHMWYYSHAKACLTSQIRRDGVYPGTTSRRVVRQKVGLLSGSVAGEVLPIRPDSKVP